MSNNEPIWETHRETLLDLAEAISEITHDRSSAIVQVENGDWWGFAHGELIDVWESKWPALQTIRDMLTAREREALAAEQGKGE